MMNLCIDSGNSFMKIAIFENTTLILFQERVTHSQVKQLCEEYPIEQLMICDVSNTYDTVVAYLPKHIPIQKLTYQTPLPITNLYETPQTLGMDRIAAVLGAYALYPNQACLVIDAGSCITYDFLSAEREYCGGSISLGLQMRFKALHEFTAKLPLLTPSVSDFPAQLGKNTEQAIKSGVINGLLYEIDAIIASYTQKYGNVQVLFCGGDAPFLHARVQAKTEVHNLLLLQGLHQVLLGT